MFSIFLGINNFPMSCKEAVNNNSKVKYLEHSNSVVIISEYNRILFICNQVSLSYNFINNSKIDDTHF